MNSYGFGVMCTTMAAPNMGKGKRPPPPESFIPWLKDDEEPEENQGRVAANMLRQMALDARRAKSGN